MMDKILVSACLIGNKVRYDGGDCLQNNNLLQQWIKDKRIITICPEMAGGLPTPRDPAERIGLKVITNTGIDVTIQYQKGAELALSICKLHNIRFALLKARSPSCGNEQIYDGSFSNTKIDGRGVTAELLLTNGVCVFNESQIDELAKLIN